MVDHAFPSVGGFVRDKGFHLGTVGREANQVQIGAANERGTVRFRPHDPATVLQLGENKGINRGAHLILVLHSRYRRLDGPFERPPVAVLLCDLSGFALLDLRV